MSDFETSNLSFERERGVYAVQVTHDVAHAVISVPDDDARAERVIEVFQALAGASVSVFLSKLHRAAVTLAVAGADLVRTEKALADAGFVSRTRRDLSLVAVRAASMREMSGVMVAIAEALGGVGARLVEVGDSHDAVLCLIEADRVRSAVDALLETFHLDASAVREVSADTEDAA